MFDINLYEIDEEQKKKDVALECIRFYKKKKEKSIPMSILTLLY